MKKTLLSLGAAALVLSFASCKKDYTCTCIDGGDKTVTIFENTTHHDASVACPKSQTYTSGTSTYTYTCELDN